MTNSRLVIASSSSLDGLFLADLQADAYTPITAEDCETALGQLVEPAGGLITALGERTLELIDAIRSGRTPVAEPQLPILALIAGADHLCRTRLLERGADDAMGIPYSYPELRARLGARLRRANARRGLRVLEAGSLRLDLRTRQAHVAGASVQGLAGKEYELLLKLIGDPERVFSRQELLRDVWGYAADARTRTVGSHASRLRRRLQFGAERFVHNVWGVGYRLVDPFPVA